MRIVGIDLTWVYVGKRGGIESYIRNLLDGFYDNKDLRFSFLLFTSLDNSISFIQYTEDQRFHIQECPINSVPIHKRLLWQNTGFLQLIKKCGVDTLFTPYYCQPLRKIEGVKYITVVHDIQAYHYPQYFSKIRRWWLIFSWKNIAKITDRIVSISDFAKEDFENNFPLSKGRVQRIYNYIKVNFYPSDFSEVARKYDVKEYEYFYCISMMLKHKNLFTIVKLIKYIADNQLALPRKLLISGPIIEKDNEIFDYIKANNLTKYCIFTGFISNEEKYSLLRHCGVFLCPSLFEGFGMPLVEAMMIGARCVSTKKGSLYEVSEGKATYVDDPLSVPEWAEKCGHAFRLPMQQYSFDQYSQEEIIAQYYNLLIG